MWETVKLGDICSFQGGSQPPKSQFIYEEKEGYVRFLQIRDFKSDKNVTYIPISKKKLPWNINRHNDLSCFLSDISFSKRSIPNIH